MKKYEIMFIVKSTNESDTIKSTAKETSAIWEMQQFTAVWNHLADYTKNKLVAKKEI